MVVCPGDLSLAVAQVKIIDEKPRVRIKERIVINGNDFISVKVNGNERA
jgi:hypothetical protein